MPKIVTAAEAVKLIPDGATIAVNSSSGLCCPDAVLKALGERFDREGHPKGLHMLHPIAAGDMFGIKGIEQGSVPMILENTPTAFHRVVLAVVRRIVSQTDMDLMLLSEMYHPIQELGSSSTVLRTIVLKQNERVDRWKPGLILKPPRVDCIHNAIAGHFGRAKRNGQLVLLGEQKAHGSHLAIRFVIVIERSNGHAAFAIA